MTDPKRDPIAVAQAMTHALDGLSERLESALVYGRRNRLMIWLTIAGLLLDIFVTVGLIFSYAKANQASDQAEAVRRQQRDTCLSSNESRALNVKLWEYVLSAQPSTPRSSAQAKQITDFRQFMRMTFAPRDCSKI